MGEAERERHYAEALHVLFQLADNDNSSHVDPTELSAILKQLEWRASAETTSGHAIGSEGSQEWMLPPPWPLSEP